MPGLYCEQFFLGQSFNHPWSRTVTEMDNVMYCALTMNVAPIHLDEHYMAGTPFGQRIAAGLYTAGLMIGRSINDTIRTRTKLVRVRESKSRPDAGLVEFEHTGINQHDVVVATCRRTALMQRQPKPA